jgi:hypothetical protein
VKFKAWRAPSCGTGGGSSRFGHDADTVTGEGLGGATDPAVLDAALAADRILFTPDKGTANLQRYPIQWPCAANGHITIIGHDRSASQLKLSKSINSSSPENCK